MALSKYLPVIWKVGSFVLYYSGAYSVYRRCCLRNKVTFVFYHDILETSPLPETQLFVEERYFWEHVEKLSGAYSIIGMPHCISGNALPAYPMVITFDGYSHRYLALAQQLSERDIKALFYLQTEPILTGQPHWRQQLYFLFTKLRNIIVTVDFDDEPFLAKLTESPNENITVAKKLAHRMERLEDKHVLIYDIADRYQCELEDFNIAHRPLTPNEVLKLSMISGIEIGSHSHSHIVSDYQNHEEALSELQRSKELLEQWTKKPVLHYAYPSGFINEGTEELLPEVGYLTATMTGAMPLDPLCSAQWPYRIPRFGVSNGPFYVLAGHLTEWEKALHGLIGFGNKATGRSYAR